MSRLNKLFTILTLFVLLTLAFATPAYAFDGRSGDKVVINAGDVVNDDLYATGSQIIMDGTVNGDVVAFGQTVTINGTVNGSLIAAAQTVVVNGTVTGNIRMAGSVLFLGENAKVGGDVVSAGYSLEVRKGSTVGRDVVYAGGQILVSGGVSRNLLVATGGLEIDGIVGGNVTADVGEADQGQMGPPPSMFMSQSTVAAPLVKTGLTVDPGAKIAGNLIYTQTRDLTFPTGVIGGKVTRTQPRTSRGNAGAVESPGQKVVNWGFDLVRSLVTLLLIGLLLLWLFPLVVGGLTEKLQTKPWPSLGWGVVACAAFLFSLLLITFVMILGAILFGVLTLGGLSGTIIELGILGILTLIVGFFFITSFVAKVVFGMALGKWILVQAKSPLAEHRLWPMVIGVAVMVIVIAVLSFPLVPGFLGGLLSFVIVLFGLGAVWLWGREALARKPGPQAS
jgi:cytoskeletal protein CcmA (bactofilin family)